MFKKNRALNSDIGTAKVSGMNSEPSFLFFVSIPLLLTVLACVLLPRRGLGRTSGTVMLLFSAIFAAAFILYGVDSDAAAARALEHAAEARAEGFAPADDAPADMPPR